jgi:hypothetical protein
MNSNLLCIKPLKKWQHRSASSKSRPHPKMSEATDSLIKILKMNETTNSLIRILRMNEKIIYTQKCINTRRVRDADRSADDILRQCRNNIDLLRKIEEQCNTIYSFRY